MNIERDISSTGLRVQGVGLGAMPLSIAGRPAESDALAVIAAFMEAGGNFIDTANVYCLDDRDIGHSERLIAKALTQHAGSSEVVVATKGGLTRPRGSWEVNGDPAWLRESCERSLRDLEVECIVLYQLHAPDPKVPLEDSVGELVRMQEEGKIRHIGLSNVSLRELQSALQVAAIVSVQNRCNVFRKRDFSNGIIEFCGERRIAYLPHSPAGGHHGHARLGDDPALRELGRKYDTTAQGVAVAWLLARGLHIIPIPGASKVASVQASAQALHLRLDDDDLERLDSLPDW